MIEHAGLKSLFDGTGEYKDITFFGLTSLSIRRYLLENGYERVTDIPEGKCMDILQKLIVPKRLMLGDVPRGNRLNRGGATFTEYDGMRCPALRGELFLWTFLGVIKGSACGRRSFEFGQPECGRSGERGHSLFEYPDDYRCGSLAQL